MPRIPRSMLLALGAITAVLVAGCAAGFAYHPGVVYYDATNRPYTYAEYGGGYRTVYVEPSEVRYRGGVAVVASGGVYAAPPAVYVAPPDVRYRGNVEVVGSTGVDVVRVAPPPAQVGVYVEPPHGHIYVQPPSGGVYVQPPSGGVYVHGHGHDEGEHGHGDNEGRGSVEVNGPRGHGDGDGHGHDH